MSILTITYGAESPNTLIRSSRWNQNVTDISTFINNNSIDSNDNIKNGGVSTSSLADGSVTDVKIAGIITGSKVSGSALTGLSGTPPGAGPLPGVNGGVPSGAILMWSGTIAAIPSGYFLCNGANSTPDLRDKFIVGARQDNAGIANTNYTGSLTQSGGSVDHTHTYSGTTSTPIGAPTITAGNNIGVANATHTHTFSGTTSNESVVPVVYYALAFIMKS